MTSDRPVPVAIIGGGFSGTILAAQLARRGIASVLVDGSGRVGKGVAYSTTDPAHLLNVRAEGMSAWAGEPDHFAARFAREGGDRRDFAQRRLFGRYVGTVRDSGLWFANPFFRKTKVSLRVRNRNPRGSSSARNSRKL